MRPGPQHVHGAFGPTHGAGDLAGGLALQIVLADDGLVIRGQSDQGGVQGLCDGRLSKPADPTEVRRQLRAIGLSR